MKPNFSEKKSNFGETTPKLAFSTEISDFPIKILGFSKICDKWLPHLLIAKVSKYSLSEKAVLFFHSFLK